MKLKSLATGLALFTTAPSAFGLIPLQDHIDIIVNYRPADSAWKWILRTESEDLAPAHVYFPARDKEFPEGEKEYHPGGNEWNFTGVTSGQPLWIYPESSPAFSASWLGFGDTSASLVNPVRFTLAQVLGPAGGHFALYRVLAGVPTVFMSTVDGVTAADFYPKPQGHHHVSWSFSRKGMWAVDLKASAFSTPSNLPTVLGPTDTTRLFFAIGEKAAWRAARFDATTVMDDAIAGEMADPDQDGWVNLLEYAFGGDPRQNGLRRENSQISAAPVLQTVVHVGQNYAGISFFRLRDTANAELEYSVEWQSGLIPSAWAAGGVLLKTEIIDAKWERVIYRDGQPLAATPRFVRIRIECKS